MFSTDRRVDQILVVNSSEADTITESSIRFKLDHPLIGVKRIRLLYFSIMHTFYNITSRNNTLTFEDPVGNPIQLTLTPGSYSINLLLDAIKTQMDALGTQPSGYTITFDPISHLVTFSATNDFRLLFGTDSALADLLGFDPVDTPVGTSFTAQRVYNLAYPNHIIVKVNEIPSNVYSADGRTSNYIVPVDVPFGDKIVFKSRDYWLNELSFLEPINLTTLSLTIMDNLGTNLDSYDFTAVLEFINK